MHLMGRRDWQYTTGVGVGIGKYSYSMMYTVPLIVMVDVIVSVA